MESPDDFVPSTPNPAAISQVAVILRHLITAGCTLGVIRGVYSDDALTIVATCIIAIANAGYALYDLRQKKRKDHEGSVASARLQKPVTPV
jgi:hypothetical protein